MMQKHGLLLGISSPSGAGKTTLCKKLLSNLTLNLSFSISVTTRNPRPNEKNGEHYFFITEEEFIAHKNAGNLLEWAEVHGYYYGTLRKHVEDRLDQGNNILLDIDWQGVLQIKEQLADDFVTVFILPPSLEELEKRLQKRNENSKQDIALRLRNAQKELEQATYYDYVIVNDDLSTAYQALESIIIAEQHKAKRFLDLKNFLNNR